MYCTALFRPVLSAVTVRLFCPRCPAFAVVFFLLLP